MKLNKKHSLFEGSGSFSCFSTPHPDPERSEGEGSLTMNRGVDQAGYAYIFTNEGNSVLYTGVTTNLPKRSYYHKRKYLRGFTKRYNLNKLVYYEAFVDIMSARVRERKIKGWKREKKIGLIENQ